MTDPRYVRLIAHGLPEYDAAKSLVVIDSFLTSHGVSWSWVLSFCRATQNVELRHDFLRQQFGSYALPAAQILVREAGL